MYCRLQECYTKEFDATIFPKPLDQLTGLQNISNKLPKKWRLRREQWTLSVEKWCHFPFHGSLKSMLKQNRHSWILNFAARLMCMYTKQFYVFKTFCSQTDVLLLHATPFPSISPLPVSQDPSRTSEIPSLPPHPYIPPSLPIPTSPFPPLLLQLPPPFTYIG